MSESVEFAKTIGAFTSAPIGGGLIGLAVTPFNRPCDPFGRYSADQCENFFGASFGGVVGVLDPGVTGTLVGLFIALLAIFYVYIRESPEQPL